MSTGKKIKQARKRAGMTQKELGKKLGISQAAVGQFEKENSSPKLVTLQRIAVALNVNIDELVDDFSELPEVKRANAFSEINWLVKYLNEDIVDIPIEKKKIITDCMKKEIAKYENDSDPKKHSLELAVKYSHYILDCLLENYSGDDVADIILLLSYYLDLNNDGKDKVSNYAIDIHGNRFYRSTFPPDQDEPELFAAHARTDVEQTPEGQQHDSDIMHNPDEWE